MQSPDPNAFYQQQLNDLSVSRKKLLDNKANLAVLRILFLVAAFAALWKLSSFNWIIALVSFALLIGAFLIFLVRDLRNNAALENNSILKTINDIELSTLQHNYSSLPEGRSFNLPSHPYSNDLDIFGPASLYQYSNRTNSGHGNAIFAAWLLNPATNPVILKRQEATKELSAMISATQQFRAYGQTDPITLKTEKNILDWLNTSNHFLNSSLWKAIRFIFPLIAISTLAAFVLNKLPFSYFSLLIIVYFAISFWISRIIHPFYIPLQKIVAELESLLNSLRWVEETNFKSPLLKDLKAHLQSTETSASQSIHHLKKILERFDYRYNPLVFLPLNIFFLWDLQQIFSLEKWKTGNHSSMPSWFESLADTEALVSLATLSFNHPGWTFPSVTNNKGVFIADDLGHPLIPHEKRITSSFATEGEKHIALVTGSNMAGKSTFLRSVGVNTVLALMGAPVCCRQLTISNMKIMSSMRISDNLEENTSTFYAELKKLKEIIEAVNRHEPVFLLLDEILRGTNSADRHTGSIALIRQLIKKDACGIIATHDLELTKLSSEFPGVLHNYHFDVQVNGEELYFDYRLKDGICTSMNASLLMKKIGIDL